MRRGKTSLASQNGNALFLILIAVALFAALSYAVTQSSRGGGAGVDAERVELQAAGVVQYGTSLSTAAMRMTISGIDSADIEFDLPGTGSYGGPDVSKEIFNPSGGGMTAMDANALCGGSCAAVNYFNGWAVKDVGTNAADILLLLSGVSWDLCSTINDNLGFGAAPVMDPNADVVIEPLPGEYDGCVYFQPLGTGQLYYYHVIAAR